MFIKVDLPAPFSPTNAWTSPGSTSKSTLSSACTPGKRRLRPRRSSKGCADPGALMAASPLVFLRLFHEHVVHIHGRRDRLALQDFQGQGDQFSTILFGGISSRADQWRARPGHLLARETLRSLPNHDHVRVPAPVSYTHLTL